MKTDGLVPIHALMSLKDVIYSMEFIYIQEQTKHHFKFSGAKCC